MTVAGRRPLVTLLRDRNGVIQCLRQATGETSGLLREGRILLCDRDPKWSRGVEQWLGTGGVRVVRTPARAPNCNASAERFVRSVKEECLNRIVPLGERHLRRTLHEFATHYRRERNHQGLGNELIESPTAQRPTGGIRRRRELVGFSATTTGQPRRAMSNSSVGQNGLSRGLDSRLGKCAARQCSHWRESDCGGEIVFGWK